jgi:hypothetical protein
LGVERLREELKVTIPVDLIYAIRKEVDVETSITPVRNSADEAVFSGVGDDAHTLLPIESVFFDWFN